MNRKFHLMAVVTAVLGVLGLAATFAITSGAVPVSALSQELASSIEVSVDHPLVRSGEQLTVNVSLSEATDTVSVLQVNVQDPQEALQVSTPGEQTVTIPPGATSTSIVLRTRADPPADQVPEISISVGNVQLLPSATFTVSVLGNSVLRDFAIVVETETVLLNDTTEVVAARDELLVHLWHDATPSEYEEVLDYIRSQDLEIVAFHRDLSSLQIRISSDASEMELARDLNGLSGVLSAGPNQIARPNQSPPDATVWGNYWVGDINLARGWQLEDRFSTGTADVLVAVVDDFLNFPDLGEISHGQNAEGFVRAVSRYSDIQRFHIPGATSVSAPSSSILSALSSAINSGVKVINLSWGAGIRPEDSASERHEAQQRFRLDLLNAITAAHDNDVLVVTSAGNDELKEDNELFPKARFEDSAEGMIRLEDAERRWRSNVINVGASSKNKRDVRFSLAGANVDLFAPGQWISYHSDGSNRISGTSFSAPQVAGAAAVVSNVAPHLNAPQLKQIIIDSADVDVLAGPTCPRASESLELFFHGCFINSDRLLTDPLPPLQNNRRLNLGAAVALATAVTGTANPLTNNQLQLGGTGTGMFSRHDETHSWNFTLNERTFVNVQSRSGIGLRGNLLNSQGNELAQSDGFLNQRDFRIERWLDAGSYTVEVELRESNTALNSPYEILVDEVMVEHTLTDNVPLMDSVSASDRSLPAYYQLEVPESLRGVEVVIASTDTYNDAAARLLNGEGIPVAEDDDGRGFRFYIARVLEPGTYYLSVQRYISGSAGNRGYRPLNDLEIVFMGHKLELGGTGMATFRNYDEVQRWMLELTERTFVNVQTRSDIDDIDLSGRLLNSQGDVLAQSDGFLNQHDFRIERWLDAGTYTVEMGFRSYDSLPESSEPPYPYEILADAVTARQLQYGSTITENIPESDRSLPTYYRLEVPALMPGEEVVIESTGDNDPIALLLDSEGTPVESDDDGGSSTNFRITRTLQPGTYYISVQPWIYSSSENQNYPLLDNLGIVFRARTADDTRPKLELGEMESGTFFNRNEVHRRTLALTERTFVNVQSRSGIDLHGTLLDSRGEELVQSDDFLNQRDFRIERWLDAGTYTVEVRLVSGVAPDSPYQILADEVVMAGDLTGHTTVIVDVPASERSLPAYYRIEVPERLRGAEVLIESIGSNDPVARLLDSEGMLVEEDDDGGHGSNFGIRRMLDPGIYYLSVQSFIFDFSGNRDYNSLEDLGIVFFGRATDDEAGGPLELGGTGTEAFLSPDEVHRWTLELNERTFVNVQSRSGIDLIGKLLDSQGAELVQSDDFLNQRDFRIERWLDAGIYTVEVELVSGDSLGGLYEILADEMVVADTLEDNVPVTINVPASERSLPTYYRIEVPEELRGEEVVIESTGDGYFFPFFFTYLSYNNPVARLLNSEGEPVEFDTDDGRDADFHIARTLEPGTYYLSVQPWIDDLSGNRDYESLHDLEIVFFSVLEVVGGPLELGGIETGTFLSLNQVHRWTLDLDTRTFVNVQTRLDAELRVMLLDSQGNELAQSDGFLNQRNFRIERWLDAGTYTVEVRLSSGESLGRPYEILADEAVVSGQLQYNDQAMRVSVTSPERSLPAYYQLEVPDRRQVVIESTGNNDPTARLLDSEGIPVAENDQGGDGDNFRIVKTLDAGTYYISVQSFIFPDQHNAGYRARDDLGLVFREPTLTEESLENALGSVGFERFPVSPVGEGTYVDLSLEYYDPAGFVASPQSPLSILLNFSDGRSPQQSTGRSSFYFSATDDDVANSAPAPLVLTLTDPAGVSLAAGQTMTSITITDNDIVEVGFSFYDLDQTVLEGEQVFLDVFLYDQDGSLLRATQTVSVVVNFSDGRELQMLEIESGSRSALLTVNAPDDGVENSVPPPLVLTLSDPINAKLRDSHRTATITLTEPPPPQGVLELGGMGTGTFLTRNEVHNWTLELDARTFVNVQSRSGAGLHGTLLDSQGNELAQSSGFLNQDDFRIERWLDAGNYTVEVRLSSSDSLDSPYEILADDVVVAGRLAYNGRATTINVPSSERSLPAYYQLEVPERRRVAIESMGDDDPTARLLDSEGIPVAENDQSGNGDNFRIVRTLDAGTYYVSVQSFISSGQHNAGYPVPDGLGVVFREPTPTEAALDNDLGSVGFSREQISPVEEGVAVELDLEYYNPAGFLSRSPSPVNVLVNFSDGRAPRTVSIYDRDFDNSFSFRATDDGIADSVPAPLVLTLTNPVGVNLADDQAMTSIVITDDDGASQPSSPPSSTPPSSPSPPSSGGGSGNRGGGGGAPTPTLMITVTPSAAAEVQEGNSITYTITRTDAEAAINVMVRVTASSGGANPNELSTATTVAMPAGTTSVEHTITALPDEFDEGDERFAITFTPVDTGGSPLGPPQRRELTVTNREPFGLEVDTTPLIEGAIMTVRVTRPASINLNRQFNLGVRVQRSDSRDATTDDLRFPDSVTLRANVRFVDFQVQVLRDMLEEPDERFNLIVEGAGTREFTVVDRAYLPGAGGVELAWWHVVALAFAGTLAVAIALPALVRRQSCTTKR